VPAMCCHSARTCYDDRLIYMLRFGMVNIDSQRTVRTDVMLVAMKISV
jgi:hypothetical protein